MALPPGRIDPVLERTARVARTAFSRTNPWPRAAGAPVQWQGVQRPSLALAAGVVFVPWAVYWGLLVP